MSLMLCISDFQLQCKHLEKYKSNRAKKNRFRKSKVFCMYGTVALRSPLPNFFDRSATDLQLDSNTLKVFKKICFDKKKNY